MDAGAVVGARTSASAMQAMTPEMMACVPR